MHYTLNSENSIHVLNFTNFMKNYIQIGANTGRATLNSSREVKCPSMKLSTFLTEQDIGTVEVLYIDCEGLDLLILKSVNLFDLDIKCIYFEYWPHQNDDKSGNFSTTRYELDEFFNLYKDFYEIEECNIEGMKTFKMIRTSYHE